MKYLILTYASQQDYDGLAGKATAGGPAWSAADFGAMGAFMESFNQDLSESGELVETRGLTAPVHARRIRLQDGVPVVTDGPYAETQEVLAGYWVVECESFDRATEIAARLAQCPAPEGVAARADRPAPQRAGPQAPRGSCRPGAAPRPVAGSARRQARGGVRRHADPAFPVLSSRAVGRVADRAHAAGRRRPGHRGDRPRISGAGGDHDPAHQPGQAAGLCQRRGVPDARRPGPRRPAGRRSPRALPDLQRGLRRHIRAETAAWRADPRSDLAWPPGAPT